MPDLATIVVTLIALMLSPILFVTGVAVGVLFRRLWWAFALAGGLGALLMELIWFLPFRAGLTDVSTAWSVGIDALAAAIICIISQVAANRILNKEAKAWR
ncbi:MAG: hypothetical protein AAGA05_01890 [Pseudomonadota bacterium]